MDQGRGVGATMSDIQPSRGIPLAYFSWLANHPRCQCGGDWSYDRPDGARCSECGKRAMALWAESAGLKVDVAKHGGAK